MIDLIHFIAMVWFFITIAITVFYVVFRCLVWIIIEGSEEDLMKKLLCILAMVLVLIVGTATAADWTKYSDQGTTSAAVTALPGYCHGIIVSANSVSSGSIIVYDNATAASGSQIFPTIYVDANATEPRNITLFPPVPVKFFNGIYVSVTTTAGTLNYEVYFRND